MQEVGGETDKSKSIARSAGEAIYSSKRNWGLLKR